MVWVPTAKKERKIKSKQNANNNSSSGRKFGNSPRKKSRFVTVLERTPQKVNVVQSSDEDDESDSDWEGPSPPTLDLKSRFTLTAKASVELVESSTLEEIFQTVLRMLKIKYFTTQKSSNGKYILTTFCLPSSQVEIALICLQQHGIGNNDYTSVSVIQSSIQLRGEDVLNVPEEDRPSVILGQKISEQRKLERKIEVFYNSIKSRMLVAEVVARIRAGGEFTFDYLMLLFLASCISFMGLVENSTVVLVASMLVSPLMGPILAGIFGTVIHDHELRSQGIRHEFISLFICICTGFIFGLMICPWVDIYGVEQWPTQEMLVRGHPKSLYVGVLIAIPSGAGVALSVLGGNAGSLVGVAISASLLPPAVNCGLLWAIALICYATGEDYLIGYTNNSGLTSDAPTYVPLYSDNKSLEAMLLGAASLTLTLVNIICIIVTGIIILKLKEVTPDKIPQNFSNFWKRDVKIHRDYFQTLKTSTGSGAAEQLLQEARETLGIGRSEDDEIEGTFLHSMFERAQEENDKINIKEWVTLPPAQAPPTRQLLHREFSRQFSSQLSRQLSYGGRSRVGSRRGSNFGTRRRSSAAPVTSPLAENLPLPGVDIMNIIINAGEHSNEAFQEEEDDDEEELEQVVESQLEV